MVELLRGWHFPPKLQPLVDSIQPRDVAVFHGNVDIEKINAIEKSMITNVKALFGDFRNWDAITSWATSIVNTLKETRITSYNVCYTKLLRKTGPKRIVPVSGSKAFHSLRYSSGVISGANGCDREHIANGIGLP